MPSSRKRLIRPSRSTRKARGGGNLDRFIAKGFNHALHDPFQWGKLGKETDLLVMSEAMSSQQWRTLKKNILYLSTVDLLAKNGKSEAYQALFKKAKEKGAFSEKDLN